MSFDSTSEKRKEPPPKPAFSFGDIMADLNKQKEPEPAQPVEEGPPETEEEREKRLRKEARRKLRVSWKPESSLTEVRYFTHDPEEELGPGDRPQREAGDVKGEGRILKLHKDVDELGEEDEGAVREVKLLDYRVPPGMEPFPLHAVNLDLTKLTVLETATDLPSEDRARNFIKRGGTQEPTSPEKKAQEHREATTLMVFYTSLADVPPSPKEPPPPSDDEIVPDEQAFGELPDHVKVSYHCRNRIFKIVANQRIHYRLVKNGTTPLSTLSQQHLLPRRPRHLANSTSPTCSRSSKVHRLSSSHRRKHRRSPRPSLLHQPHLPTWNGPSTCFVNSSNNNSSRRLRYRQQCRRYLNFLYLNRRLRKASTSKSSYPSSTLKNKHSNRLFFPQRRRPSLESHQTSQLSYPSSMVKACRQVRTKRPAKPMKIPSVNACVISAAQTAPAMNGPNELDLTSRTRNM